MKALLLAGGLGTRLRPLTNITPKCLVDIGGQKLLGRWLIDLEKLGCEEVIINTHHLANQVEDFLASLNFRSMKVTISHEISLLGTAGTLLKHSSALNTETVLLIHADNITNADLSLFIKAHATRPAHCLMTMLTFDTKNPQRSGIVETNDSKVVIRFHEKTSNPPGNCANGAIYALDSSLINDLKKNERTISDFSTEVIPEYLGRIYTWHTNADFYDIGTPQALDKARQIWSRTQSDAFKA